MNKLILSPLTLLGGEVSSNRDNTRFNGTGSFREAYGDRAVREIQILAFGKTAEKLGEIAVGSKLETSGEYRSESRDLGNGKKEYLNIFLINKITRVGKPSEASEDGETNQEAIAPVVETKKTTQKTKVAPVYTPPAETDSVFAVDSEDIPF
jgi:hypothetical protein